MQIKKIDIDTLAYASDAAPDFGTIAIDLGGRRMNFRLDQPQVERFAKLGAEIAAEIVGEIANTEPVAA